MDPLALLAEAGAAGLEVRRDGERLIVRGPKSAEALASRLLDQKARILAALDPPADRGGPVTADSRARAGHCPKCKAPTDDIRQIPCGECNARRLGAGADGAGDQCAVHGRFLTLREQEVGCCSWCNPDQFEWSAKDRQAIQAMNRPRPARAPVPCQSCGSPLPPGRWSLCARCFDKEFPE